MKKYRFHLCPNCFPRIRQDIFWQQASRTPVRAVALPAGTDLHYTPSLIPEFMVDVPLGGKWECSLPDLQDTLKRYGLDAAAIGCAGNVGYPGSERMLRSRIDFACRMGIRAFNIACEPGLNDAEQRTACRLFSELGKYAGDRGVTLYLETFGGLTRNGKTSLETLERIGNDHFRINYDTGNVLQFTPEFSHPDQLIEDMRLLGGCLGMLHLKDRRIAAGETVPLGSGDVDFHALFRTLDCMEFEGLIGLDLETAAASRQGTVEAHAGALRQSLNYLQNTGVIL